MDCPILEDRIPTRTSNKLPSVCLRLVVFQRKALSGLFVIEEERAHTISNGYVTWNKDLMAI